MKVTFITGSGADASNEAANTSLCINCYPETIEQGGRSRVSVRSALGTKAFADLGIPLCREMERVDGVLYAAAGGKLFKVDDQAVVTELGDIEDDEFTTISGNNGDVVITAGGVYHVYDGGTVAPYQGYLEGEGRKVGSAAFHEYRTISTQLDGDYWDWSDLAGPKTRPTLNFKRNEAKPDNTLRVMVDGRQVYFFGETAIEIWASSGQANEAAYTTRLTVIEQGVKSAALICKPDNGFFFIGNDNVPYLLSGNQPAPLSHPGVIADLEATTPERCFYFEDRGHKFCVIRFRDRPAWVFDIAMAEWSQRSTGVNHDAWDAVATVFAYGKWFLATTTGKIYEMARNGTDVVTPLKRSFTTLPYYNDGERFRIALLELLGEFGTNSSTIMLEMSRDGGKTWSDPIAKTVSELASYERLVRWRRLGRGRNICFRFTYTDPHDVTFYGEGNMKVA